MPYIQKIRINIERERTFPFDVPAIRHARKEVRLDSPITFFIGDNGTGKSTLIETLAFRLQLPQLDSSEFNKRSFAPAISLAPHLEVSYAIHRSTGFFFRAEDFGDYINSVDRRDASLQSQLDSLRGEVPEHIIQEMKDNANDQLWRMRSQYGQDLQSFSHGEAYLKIIHDKIQDRGIYILDEPEAALSPSRQLSLIYFIVRHLQRFNSQFIIATHSPMLMAIPGARIYEITETDMRETGLEDTEHFTLTRNFLLDPDAFLRHLTP